MSLTSSLSTPGLQAALARAHAGDLQAWDDFVSLRQEAGREGVQTLRLLATAGLVVTGHNLGRFEHFRTCVEELLPLRRGGLPLGGSDELLVLNGLLIGLLLCHPRDPAVDATATRLRLLVEGGHDVNLTLAAARTLNYYFDAGDLREPAMHVHALISARAGEPAATPYRLAEWLNLWARCAHYGKQPECAEQAAAQMRELARKHGLRSIEFAAALFDFDVALPRGDLAAMRSALDRAEGLVEPARLRQVMQLELAKTRLASSRGQTDTALHHGLRARKLAVELQMPPVILATYVVNEAQARLLGNDFEGARNALHGEIGSLPEGYAGEIQAMVAGIDAYLAARDGASDAHARLSSLWRGLRERRSYDLFEGFPEFGARLCVLALEREIETDFVRSLIAKCNLLAPAAAPANWPWPLRIQALGGFAVWRDDVLLATEGKAQRKPLTLLQAVIAHGAFRDERGVEVARLIDLLWPDVDAADPKSSFEVALSRLRKWLGAEGALRLVDGRLSLNPRVVWCDVDALEHVCDELHRALQPHADASALPRWLSLLGSLYRGKLFGVATLEPWSVVARERLSLRFARAVSDAGAHMEAEQLWGEAVALYEASLVQDMLAEPVHRALMRCHLALGQHAEARRAYERCRTVLRAELGLSPSEETRTLMQRADAAG